MEKNIIISSLNNLAAILHDGYLHELILSDCTYQLGNIYLGSVNKIFPKVRAIFITVQINRKYKNGFLHVNDLLKLRNGKRFFLNTTVVFKQKLYVQVIKEAFFGKNPRVTTNITLAGRYIVFSPLNKVLCISRKIEDIKEKEYLKSLGLLLTPFSSGGIFFRQYANKVSNSMLIEEWKILKLRWQIILRSINYNLNIQYSLLYKDSDILKKVIRDFYNLEICSIFVDHLNIEKKINSYLKYWYKYNVYSSPHIYIISRYFLEIFKLHSILSQISSFRIELIPAGYIFIETFEAFTFIDVNSGIFDKQKYPVSLILALNCSAAKEIAYQIKIRNISGIIIIDFIDMNSKKDQLELLRYLHKLFNNDTVLTQVVQFSELGLVEITRKRGGKSMFEILLNYQTNFIFCELNMLSASIKYIEKVFTKSSYLCAKFHLFSTINTLNLFKRIPHESVIFSHRCIQYNNKKIFLNTVIQTKIKVII
uniref:Ribonuclease E n=1 Tax=Bangiopsis subsimplex TaxID=139980 RepID=A0A1C9CCP2_9RHOD|nr:ribonuclease E [Bangiopsis subsimplex]AOM66163.1 ribonuclease E [Bangiopsis subsimplex]ARO90477.1 ribonuclease E [Bangiopsis subsimplex]